MGRQVNTWKLWWLNSLICENHSFLLQGPEMLMMPNISSALFLWHPRVEAFSPLNWSCLLYGKGGLALFCVPGEWRSGEQNISESSWTKKPTECLPLEWEKWVWWLRAAASHSITVSQHSFKGKSWLTDRFRFFEGVDKHVAEGDLADITRWDAPNSFNEISHQKLMQKVSCHEVEGLLLEREVVRRKDLMGEKAHKGSLTEIHARNCAV